MEAVKWIVSIVIATIILIILFSAGAGLAALLTLGVIIAVIVIAIGGTAALVKSWFDEKA